MSHPANAAAIAEARHALGRVVLVSTGHHLERARDRRSENYVEGCVSVNEPL